MTAKAAKAVRFGGAGIALAITIGIPLLAIAGSFVVPIALPLLDHGRREAGWGLLFSAFSLGILPYVTAANVVELGAVVVPSLNRLRHGGPKGRQKLTRATIVVAVIFASIQAFAATETFNPLGLAEDGASRALAMLVMVMTSALLVFLAELASRRGLVSGYVTMVIGAEAMSEVPKLLQWTIDAPTLVGTAAAILATWFVLRATKRAAPSEAGKSPEPYRAKIDGETRHLAISVPASGIEPLGLALTFAALPALVVGADHARQEKVRAIFTDRVTTAATLAILVVSVVALASAYFWPARVAALWRRAVGGTSAAEIEAAVRIQLRKSLLTSLVFLLGLLVIGKAVERLGGWTGGMMTLPALTAIVLDVAAAYRERRRFSGFVAVWPEQRPYAIDVAREVLGEVGIPLLVRNERIRRIWPFAPTAPLDLMVPAASAKRALKLLEAALGPDGQHEVAANDRSPRLAPARQGFGRVAWPLLAAIVALGAGSMLLSSPAP